MPLFSLGQLDRGRTCTSGLICTAGCYHI